MAFISKNPNNFLNPEVGENYVKIESKNLSPGQEIIGYYKHCFVDSVYNNRCYVIKGIQDGLDYLIYGTRYIHNEMEHYSIGDKLCLRYEGERENKKGPFAGKASHCWKVLCDDQFMPSPEFIQQLQTEVYNRRIEVGNILASRGLAPQVNPIYPVGQQPHTSPRQPSTYIVQTPAPFAPQAVHSQLQMPPPVPESLGFVPKKTTNPFG